jgi:hypothetical protein
MPPADAEQPGDEERTEAVNEVRAWQREYVSRQADDPGLVPARRLTGSEYEYTIQDLTGLRLNLQQDFTGDMVGGEGFANFAASHFIDDAMLQWYLQSAKRVADRAMIGAGPLYFFDDPGPTGLELSAITRIQQIYREHGFRMAAGEGAEPFGIDLYPRAFYVAWQLQHTTGDAERADRLRVLAAAEGLPETFCDHIARLLSSNPAPFPLSLLIEQWRRMPPSGASDHEVRDACAQLAATLYDWQRTLAASVSDEEEASVLWKGPVQLRPEFELAAPLRRTDGADTAELEVSVAAVTAGAGQAIVIWHQPQLRYRLPGETTGTALNVVDQLTTDSRAELQPGIHPAGGAIPETDFALRAGETRLLKIRLPAGLRGARITATLNLDPERSYDQIVRCRVFYGLGPGDTAASTGETSVLLGDRAHPAVAETCTEIAKFAEWLPSVSQREPAPSDRDPIPFPFNGEYNQPERDYFHQAIKYFRDDEFIVQYLLDAVARRQLDDAWTDLLLSFDYHDLNWQFINRKFKLDAPQDRLAEIKPEQIAKWSPEVRELVERLRHEHQSMVARWRAAESRQVDEAIAFAVQAWRRPLLPEEESRLRAFYATQREEHGFEHREAIQALLARCLVAPSFLYRWEVTGQTVGIRPLDDWELANRLSYFLWSSLPDAELRRAAEAGQLKEPEQLIAQTRRMLQDPKARRLATEFFGQWLGFYRFDQHNGIDRQRFPEFDDSLRAALYDESVSFFEHIIRQDRPISEILFADYSFLNAELARHYGLSKPSALPEGQLEQCRVAPQRPGGLLGMGSLLAVTSAPLRTSAVKRGDWVLRRVLGTPVPSPPADAGSIAADDVNADGLSPRARLDVHRAKPACNGCHARIDPLGFALEHFDPLGRHREAYRDGQTIEDFGTLSDGRMVDGVSGLLEYLATEQSQFRLNLCRKLVGYALGREIIPSDVPLIDRLLKGLVANERFSDVVLGIVTSEQFRNRRG